MSTGSTRHSARETLDGGELLLDFEQVLVSRILDQ